MLNAKLLTDNTDTGLEPSQALFEATEYNDLTEDLDELAKQSLVKSPLMNFNSYQDFHRYFLEHSPYSEYHTDNRSTRESGSNIPYAAQVGTSYTFTGLITEAMQALILQSNTYEVGSLTKSVAEKKPSGYNGKHECGYATGSFYRHIGIPIQFWGPGESYRTATSAKFTEDPNWECVFTGNGPDADTFQARPGDVSVQFAKTSDGTNTAHACMFDGTNWKSDFVQNSCWVYGDNAGRNGNQSVLIWRYKPLLPEYA